MNKSDDEFKAIVNAAYDGNLETVSSMVANGFDLTTINKLGESVLTEICLELFAYETISHRYDALKLLLELGADVNQITDKDGTTALGNAGFSADTELFRILLDAGANPNCRIDGETLYEWCEFDYRYETWDLTLPEKVPENARIHQNSWLLWLDEIAIKYQRRRPDHLFLLREYGARTSAELENNNQQ
ncbi:MAG: ankyrin repeat domain-containing protein [Methylococcaceae bacterium]